MMQSFESSKRAFRQGLAVVALGLFVSAATAQGAHHQQAKPGKLELGMAAAVDAQGVVWTVRKETDGVAQFLVLQQSGDGGATWSAAKRIEGAPEAIAADGENRPKLAFGGKGELYISYTKPLAKAYAGEIRFIRSLDGGQTFAPPVTVHANRDLITHRYDAMMVDPQGRIYIAWIDKRDLEAARARKQDYAGAAVYYAVSDDSGATFRGDFKLADHSCECCRIALALAPDGKVMAFWRHVFEPNVRDHAMAQLTPGGVPTKLQRVTFDDWRIDACPHQGPALAYGPDGTRHQAWFTLKGEEGGVYYASAAPGAALGRSVKLGSDQADHAAIAVDGKTVVLAWRQFDGKTTAIVGKVSLDGGRTWRERELARTALASDHPQLLKGRTGVILVWRTQGEGVRIVPLRGDK